MRGGTGAVLLLAVLLQTGCGYHHYAGPLYPSPVPADSSRVVDAGAVVFQGDGLQVAVQPMTAEELNRQFASHSQEGVKSTNPFTFGNTSFWDPDRTRARFTVFRLQVANRSHPKVQLDPARIVIRADNGRQYWSLSFAQLDAYYRAYVVGYQGNEYARYQERRDLLKRSLFTNEEIFSGQTADRFVVFPALHWDVAEITVTLHDVALRFDYRNEAVETTDLSFRFARDTGRMYADGRVVLNGE
jgi:hypothetical protein